MKRKLIKILSLIIIILTIFGIYHYFKTDKIYYIALGDSLAEGMNPYGEIGYSYTDYFKDNLKENNKLSYYTKEYAKSSYTSKDIITEIKINNKLKKDLRESDLVTISIGANDFFHKINKNSLDVNEILSLKDIVTNVLPDISACIKEIRKYAKEDMIIVGYYNPIPFLFNTSGSDLDKLFAYIDEEYNKIATKYNCKYISLYQLFKKNSSYLPNPSDIHPNLEAYQEIAKIISNIYNQK